MRQNFKVLRDGVAIDDARIEFYFPKEEGLVPGDIISAEVVDQNLLTDVFCEQGPSAGKERVELESAGGPERDAVGWQPRSNPHKIAGTPHSGRFLGSGKPENAGFEEKKL